MGSKREFQKKGSRAAAGESAPMTRRRSKSKLKKLPGSSVAKTKWRSPRKCGSTGKCEAEEVSSIMSMRKERATVEVRRDCQGRERRKMSWEFVESRQRAPARGNSARKGRVMRLKARVSVTVLPTVTRKQGAKTRRKKK